MLHFTGRKNNTKFGMNHPKFTYVLIVRMLYLFFLFYFVYKGTCQCWVSLVLSMFFTEVLVSEIVKLLKIWNKGWKIMRICFKVHRFSGNVVKAPVTWRLHRAVCWFSTFGPVYFWHYWKILVRFTEQPSPFSVCWLWELQDLSTFDVQISWKGQGSKESLSVEIAFPKEAGLSS